MKQLNSASDRLLTLCGIVPGVVVALLAIGVAAEVVARNFGLTGFCWMLEAVEYGLLLLTMVGAAYVFHIGRHVTADLNLNAMPPGVRRKAGIAVNFVTVAIGLIIVYCGLVATQLAYSEDSTLYKSFEIKEWIPMAIVPDGMALFTIEALRQLVRGLRGQDYDADMRRSGPSETF